MKDKYIKINKKDFSESLIVSIDNKIRSLEKFLDKNNYDFNCDFLDGTFEIEVNDELDAMKIAEHFKLKSLNYFENNTCKVINFNKTRKKGGRPKNIIIINKTGDSMSLKNFIKKNKEDIQKRCISKTDLISRKILTRAEIEKLVIEGKLKEEKLGKSIYFDRREVSENIKK